MNRNNDLHTSMFEQSIHTGVVIACFDAFCQTITKKTVVVIDNASIHTSDEFEERLSDWKKRLLPISVLDIHHVVPGCAPPHGGVRVCP